MHMPGACSAPDATSAGGHWNLTNQAHGRWGIEPFHLGNIGNIEVSDEGMGSLDMTTNLWSLEPNVEDSVLGKAMVMHAGADDFTSQPAGASGPRVGCGVVMPG